MRQPRAGRALRPAGNLAVPLAARHAPRPLHLPAARDARDATPPATRAAAPPPPPPPPRRRPRPAAPRPRQPGRGPPPGVRTPDPRVPPLLLAELGEPLM